MLPCADVHWRILPAVCRELAICMEKEGMPQKKIAEALGATSAAVSQYLSGKRGGRRLGAAAKAACRRLAKRVANGKVKGGKISVEIAKILAIARGLRDWRGDPCAICVSSEK